MGEPAVAEAALALQNGISDPLQFLALSQRDYLIASAVISKAEEGRQLDLRNHAVMVANALARSFNGK